MHRPLLVCLFIGMFSTFSWSGPKGDLTVLGVFLDTQPRGDRNETEHGSSGFLLVLLLGTCHALRRSPN